MDTMEEEMTIRDSLRVFIANQLDKIDTFNDDYQKYLALCGIDETLSDIRVEVGTEVLNMRYKLINKKG